MAIPVSNVRSWCEDEVAEHALGLLLMAVRHLGSLDRDMHEGGWKRLLAVPAHRVAGKTVGVVGIGAIGSTVARLLSGFNVRVLACDPYLDATTIQARGAQKAELAELLAQSDIVTLHVPLTDETRCMLRAEQFAQMKPGALLVNTSRGQVVDESALIAALQGGSLGGAALDVMETEPLPAGSPLRQMPNVVLTPHLASYSVEAIDTLYRLSADIAADLLQNVWAPTIVNPEIRSRVEERWGAYTERTNS
jgi:D-3-phosphoglycerate dehydrogenase